MNRTSQRAFNELFLRHQGEVFAYILTLVPNRNDAEDVFQQTCLVLLEKQADYDPARRFFPWACGFALNEVRRFRRAHRRERTQLSDAAIESLARVQSSSAARIEARLEMLLECLDELPADKRELLMRCYACRGAVGPLAAELQMETAALYKRLERIRGLLLECIEKKD